MLPKGKDLIYVLTHLARWSEKHLDDLVDIPPEKRRVLVENPDKMIRFTLRELEKWEKEFLNEP